MAEETIWTGSSSQAKNIGAFVASFLLSSVIVSAAILLPNWWVLLGLILPIAYAAFKFLKVAAREYRLTSERLLITDGILSKSTDTMELYRVKDLRMTQPVSLRIFGLENIELTTSDKSNADIILDSVPKSVGLGDLCRTYVEACRTSKGTREIEVE